MVAAPIYNWFGAIHLARDVPRMPADPVFSILTILRSGGTQVNLRVTLQYRLPPLTSITLSLDVRPPSYRLSYPLTGEVIVQVVELHCLSNQNANGHAIPHPPFNFRVRESITTT